jgi:hypothetical protein
MTLNELYEGIAQVAYKDWWVATGEQGDGYYVQWRFFAKDNVTGENEIQAGRKWYVSRHATRSELVQTLLKAALAAEEHEARELFCYRGVAVFGPHMDVDELATRGVVEARRAMVAA